MLTKIFAGLALIAASSQTALATDWQYCLAPSQAEHKVYMSGAFPVRGALDEADNAFEQMLDRAGLRHDVVQCPRADDERSIATMEQYAIVFNRETGNTIVHCRWKRRDKFDRKLASATRMVSEILLVPQSSDFLAFGGKAVFGLAAAPPLFS